MKLLCKQIVIIFLIGVLNAEDIDNNTFLENSMKSIFQYKINNILYFEGPYDSERTLFITNIANNRNIEVIKFDIIQEDLSGEKDIDDLITHHEMEISDTSFSIDGSVMLQKPIRVGTQWQTQWAAFDFQPKGIATVKIIDISNEIITTEVTIPDVKEYTDHAFQAYFYYQRNVGILGYKQNMSYTADIAFFMLLKASATNKEGNNPWYYPWYIRKDKKKLRFYDYVMKFIDD